MGTDWDKETERWDKRAGFISRHPIGTLAIVVAVVGALGLGGLALNALLAPTVGRLNQQIQINDATNRTLQQERFETLYHDIQAADQNLAPSKAALQQAKKAGDNAQVTYWTTTLVGQEQACNSLVQEYNADALKVSAEMFRTVDLPAQVSSADPATDCQ